MGEEDGRTGLGDLGHALSYATLSTSPKGVDWPLPTGILPSSIARTGLGAVGGRYLAAPLLKYMFPQLDEDRLDRLSTVAGGALGLATMLPSYMTMGPKTPLFDKKSDWWTDTSAERAIANHVAEGNISEVEALQIYQKNREAELANTGLVSGDRFAKALTGGAMGYAGARVATSIAETLFSPKWTPQEQANMAYAGGVAGGLMSLLGTLAGGSK